MLCTALILNLNFFPSADFICLPSLCFLLLTTAYRRKFSADGHSPFGIMGVVLLWWVFLKRKAVAVGTLGRSITEHIARHAKMIAGWQMKVSPLCSMHIKPE